MGESPSQCRGDLLLLPISQVSRPGSQGSNLPSSRAISLAGAGAGSVFLTPVPPACTLTSGVAKPIKNPRAPSGRWLAPALHRPRASVSGSMERNPRPPREACLPRLSVRRKKRGLCPEAETTVTLTSGSTEPKPTDTRVAPWRLPWARAGSNYEKRTGLGGAQVEPRRGLPRLGLTPAPTHA